MASKLFNDKIRDYRLKIGLTQEQLAEESGLSLSVIKNLENGNTGNSLNSKGNILKVCETMGIDLYDVFIEDYRNTKKIAICSPKGGVGKTTTTIEIGYILATKYNKRVLLIDGDFTRSLSNQFRIPSDTKHSIRALLLRKKTVFECIKQTAFKNIDIIPGDTLINGLSEEVMLQPMCEHVFTQQIQPLIDKGIYDYIIMDMSNYYGLVNTNMFLACDKYYVPITVRAMAEEAIEPLIYNFKKIQRVYRPDFKIDGIIKIGIDYRYSNTKKIELRLNEECGALMLPMSIRTDGTVEKAQEEFMPITHYVNYMKEKENKRVRSKAAKDYAEFVKEVMK